MNTTKQPHSSLGTSYSPFHHIWNFAYLINDLDGMELQLEKGFPYFTSRSKELIEELLWCIVTDNDGNFQTLGWLRLKSSYPVTAWGAKTLFNDVYPDGSQQLDVLVNHYGSATLDTLEQSYERLKVESRRVTDVVTYRKK